MASASRRLFHWFLGETLVSLLVIVLLFLVSEGQEKWLPLLYHFIRTYTYHSNLVVYLLLIINASLFGYFIYSRFLFLPPSNRRKKVGGFCVLGLWLFTIIPVGHLIKHNHLFYENWMWYAAIGLLLTQFFFALSLYLLRYYRHILVSWEEKIAFVHGFFTSPFRPVQDGCYILVLTMFVFGLCSGLSWFMLGGIPHVQDSIAQFFQAKIFAQGRMTLPVPSNHEFFERIYVLVDHGQWYTFYPPGFPLVLSLGVLVDHPHWVNPLLSALMLPLVFYLSSRYVSMFVARISIMMLALSPFFILMGAGFMNHPAALFFLLLFLIFSLEAVVSRRYGGGFSLLAGFFYGMAFITRPMSALAFLGGGLIGVGLRASSKKRLLVFAFLFLLGNSPPAFFYLTFNQHTTGSPWVTGYEKYFGGNPLGFGDRPWGAEPLGPQLPNQVYHSPARGLANTNSHLVGLNYFLFGWPIPSLTLSLFLLFPFFRKKQLDGLCFLIILFILGIYFFYFFQDYCYGPRFMYETVPFWILLSARFIEEFFQWSENQVKELSYAIRSLTYSLLLFFFVFAFVLVWVERINVMSDAYWGTDDEIAHTMRENIEEEKVVIFVDDEQDYAAAFSFLDPTLENGWIVAHNLGAKKNEELLKKYPQWPVYRLRLHTSEGNRFETRLENYEVER